MSVARRPVETPAERAVRLWAASVDRREPIDPLFRRRLRGLVVNRYVAAREAPAATEPAGVARRRMGAIGRAALYASVALSLSVGGAMAASSAAVPGDLLYPVKRQIEELRARVLPAEFRDDLAAHAFAQRVHELERLLAAGDRARATALLAEIGAAYERLLVLRPDAMDLDGLVGPQLAVLEGLLERLPAPAVDAIERALDRAPGLNRTPHGQDADRGRSAGEPGSGEADGPNGAPPNAGAPAEHPSEPHDAPPAEKPDREPRDGRPTASPRPSPDQQGHGPADPREPNGEDD